MKARRLPRESIVLEAVENLQEIIWAKMASGVKGFIKTFIENLLREELSGKIAGRRYERTDSRRGYRNGHYVTDLPSRFGYREWNQGAWNSASLTATNGVVEMWMAPLADCFSMV